MAAERHAIERRVTLDSKYAHWDSALITNVSRTSGTKFLKTTHPNKITLIFALSTVYYEQADLYLHITQLYFLTNGWLQELN
jgi:hypothetical protein